MSFKRNPGILVTGSILIVFGLLSLVGQQFRGSQFWGYLWPLFLVAVGALFFGGMFAGGKSMAGLAIPGSIIGVLGVMMLLQSLSGHWASWAYSWSLIVVSVGLGIFIMGAYTADEHRRRAGVGVMKVGAILFVIFGGFFEMIFSAFEPYGIQRYIFPVLLVLLGAYLVVVRSGLLPLGRKDATDEVIDLSDEKK
jgi:hypothetical protein